MSWRDRENRGMERGKETKAERNRKELWRQRKGGAMAAKVAELEPGFPGCSCPPAPGEPPSLPSLIWRPLRVVPFFVLPKPHSKEPQNPIPTAVCIVLGVHKPQFPQCRICIVCMGRRHWGSRLWLP